MAQLILFQEAKTVQSRRDSRYVCLPKELAKCERCGKEFFRKKRKWPRRRGCSRPCEEFLSRKDRETNLPERACKVCNEGFRSEDPRAVVCSHTCANKVKGLRLPPQECLYCGVEFQPTEPSHLFCSGKCRNSHRNGIRRALGTGLPADTGAVMRTVFRRDRGKCQLCGGPVPGVRTKCVPRRFRPSLDHIVPHSKGGPFTLDNLQLAHVTCNSSKHAREAV